MLDIIFFSISLILLPLYVINEINKYKKETFNPLVFRLRDSSEWNAKEMLFHFGFMLPLFLISSKLLKASLAIIMISVTLILYNTLTLKYYRKNKQKRILVHLIVFDIICVILLILMLMSLYV